jgi:lipopolysaccharide/colanic/teichoic acid biosynthesis glycosyltransferase
MPERLPISDQSLSPRLRNDAHRVTFRIKRVVDIVVASLALVLLSPLIALVSIGLRLESRGPVLHVRPRVGRDGLLFRMYKFRTMTIDAEERLQTMQHLNVGGARLIRIANDPRVTPMGAILRRTSLDELPQLWNVLRGEMSLVGPRPQAPDEVQNYTESERKRLAVLPGMTGLWQVTARDNPNFEEWIRLDMHYIRNWSVWLDFQILARTPWVVVKTMTRRTAHLT